MPGDDSPAMTLVIGVGYTGGRLLRRMPAAAVAGMGRSSAGSVRATALDLDLAPTWPADAITDVATCSIVYTVPPPPQGLTDPRIARLVRILPCAPRRLVYLSTTGVYGNHDGRRVTEDTPATPATDRARRRVAAEKLLDDWSNRCGTELVVLRVPGIYGPGRLGVARIQAGEAVLRDADCGPGNRIHVDDLVSCCIAALHPNTPIGVYNVGDGDERSASWFAAEVARQAGLAAPPSISRAEAGQQFSATRLSFLNESRRVDLGKMRALLKPDIRYPNAAEGIAAALVAEKILG